MADVIDALPQTARSPASAAADEPPLWDLIELLFFAYRDFVSDPDVILRQLGFGRAHHRVLHFINRNPGMRVTELLDILRITKQSLGRVLKDLIEGGYVVQQAGPSDRRQRLLHATLDGERLAVKLARMQTARITRALDGLDPDAHERARQFLLGLIDDGERRQVLDRIGREPGRCSRTTS